MLYHARDMVWCIRQKITIELIYQLRECCHIYTHDDLSVYWFYGHERKMCWYTASDVSATISQINRHFRLTPGIFTRLSPASHTASSRLLCDTIILTKAPNNPHWSTVR